MGLNCMGPLIHEFFSVVNTAVLYNPWLVESGMQRAGYKLCSDFQLPGELAPLIPKLFKGQLYNSFKISQDAGGRARN